MVWGSPEEGSWSASLYMLLILALLKPSTDPSLAPGYPSSMATPPLPYEPIVHGGLLLLGLAELSRCSSSS